MVDFQRVTQEREGGRESPRLTPEAPSTPEPTSASVSPAPELTPEVMKKKAKSIIEEYLNIRDMKVSGFCCIQIFLGLEKESKCVCCS